MVLKTEIISTGFRNFFSEDVPDKADFNGTGLEKGRIASEFRNEKISGAVPARRICYNYVQNPRTGGLLRQSV